MTTYARVRGGIVLELFTPPAGMTIDQCFVPSIAMQYVAVPDGVSPQQGWTCNGKTFSAP